MKQKKGKLTAISQRGGIEDSWKGDEYKEENHFS